MAGTGGAVTTGKRSKRNPADWSLSERDGVFCTAARLDCPAARTLLAGTCLYRAGHHTPAATALPVSTMQPDGAPEGVDLARVLGVLERPQSGFDTVLAAHSKKRFFSQRVKFGPTGGQIGKVETGKAVGLLRQLPQRQAAHLLTAHFNADDLGAAEHSLQLFDLVGL